MEKPLTPSTVVTAIAVTVNRVDRTRNPQQVLDATGRRQYTNSAVVATMPSGGQGVQENVEVVFFKLGKYASDDEVARMFKERGLTDDPYAVSAVNEADPGFADKYPNATHWKDDDGNWCCAGFIRAGDGRNVDVGRCGHGWFAHRWFGGVRK